MLPIHEPSQKVYLEEATRGQANAYLYYFPYT